MALTDLQTLTDNLVRDDAGKVSPDQRNLAIATAVIRYSKDKPRQKVEDIASAGGSLLPLPTAWETDFSELEGLEYPIGDIPPSVISPRAWSLYAAPSGLSILLSSPLAVGSVVRAAFTITHQVDATHDTVPLADREIVCCLAAASLCDQLASLYSGDSDSTIQADTVNHSSKSKEFAARAKSLRQRYLDELGIDPKKNVAAGVVVGMDLASSLGGDRLTHGLVYRRSRRVR